MDQVLQNGSFKQSDIVIIKYCGMYLQAITVSNLCLADSILLELAMLQGKPSDQSSRSQWIHINQARPHDKAWCLWQGACKLWSTNSQLNYPLGKWLYAADNLCRS
jgi:hypothetical protein